jgi:hypothetical protein
MNKSTTCKKIVLPRGCASLQEKINQEQELKYHSHKRASYVMIKWGENILYLYDSYDL